MDLSVAVTLWLAAGLGLIWSAVRARQYWGEPAARSFSVLAGTLALASFSRAAIPIDMNVMVVAVPILYHLVPLAWAIFVLEYTGRMNITKRYPRAVLAAPVAYLVVVYIGVAVAASHHLDQPLWDKSMDTTTNLAAALTGPIEFVVYLINISEYVGYFYLIGLVFVGSAYILRQSIKYNHLGAKLGTLLVVGATGPWLVDSMGFFVTDMLGLSTDIARIPVAASLCVSALSFGWILRRYNIFTATPVAGAVGHERILKDMTEAVVVVDHEERLIRQNPAAREVFDTDKDDIGNQLSDVVGQDIQSLTADTSVELAAMDGQRQFEPSVSKMTNSHGRLLGYAIVLRDVTDRQMRQQRLGVLNRVLRHNLRNDMTAIRGRAELLTVGEGNPAEIGDTITDAADDLVALGERAREIERMLSLPQQSRKSCELDSVVSAVVEESRSEYAATISVSIPEHLTIGVDERVLRPVVYNLIVNGVVHNDCDSPSVDVSVSVGDGSLPVTLTIADDGPGLPENERIAIERGYEEDPLEHGSGLGLWAVKWGVTRMGGQLSIEENDPRGTVFNIYLPRSESLAKEGAKQASLSD